MKLKFGSSVKPGRISGGTYLVDDKMRADMFLPVWLLGLGILLVMFGGIFGIVMTALGLAGPMIILFVALIALGIGAILCWKNQTIRMLANDSFEYSTFLGNKRVYRFGEIRGFRKNNDSFTLYVGDGKVHIDACAIMSEKLEDRINRQLQLLGCPVRLACKRLGSAAGERN